MKDLKTRNSKRVNSKMNTSNVDNLKPKAFQQILDFYDEIECMSLSSWIKNNK